MHFGTIFWQSGSIFRHFWCPVASVGVVFGVNVLLGAPILHLLQQILRHLQQILRHLQQIPRHWYKPVPIHAFWLIQGSTFWLTFPRFSTTFVDYGVFDKLHYRQDGSTVLEGKAAPKTQFLATRRWLWNWVAKKLPRLWGGRFQDGESALELSRSG